MTGLLGGIAHLVVERDRAVGDLTAGEVRDVLASYLAPWEVAQIARAVQGLVPASDTVADLRASCRGYAGGGTRWETTGKGVQVRLHDPAAQGGYRAGLITWRLMRLVIRDGVTTDRLAALTTALRDKDQLTARQAAKVLVTAGPAATQLDLLDQLDQLDQLDAMTGLDDAQPAQSTDAALTVESVQSAETAGPADPADPARQRKRARARCRRCDRTAVVRLVWDGEDYSTTCTECDGLMVAEHLTRGARNNTSKTGASRTGAGDSTTAGTGSKTHRRRSGS